MKSRNNEVTFGLSGKLRLLIFRNRFGKTVVAPASEIPRPAATDAQQLVQSTFKKAAAYAKGIMADMVSKLLYQQKVKLGQSAFNLALRDYFNVPSIDVIDSSNYTGAVGSTISAEAMDDFQVASVHFRIDKPDGSMLEEGDAVMHADGLHWIYSTTVANSSLAGSKIIVTAKDLPGNSIVKQQTI